MPFPRVLAHKRSAKNLYLDFNEETRLYWIIFIGQSMSVNPFLDYRNHHQVALQARISLTQSLSVPIIHHAQQVFQTTSYVRNESMWISSCWSANTGTSMRRVKVMDCGIVVSEFVFQSRYYVHFRANTLGKGMNSLILPAMG